MSDELLTRFNIYVQSINYPTVSRGEERLRITPTPGHTEHHMEYLVNALETIWVERGLKRVQDWAKEGGRANVGTGYFSDQLVAFEDLDVEGYEALVANASA